MDNELISSHIFIFPFTWDAVKDEVSLDMCINARLDIEKFIKCLKYSNKWKEDSKVLKIVEKKEVGNENDYNTYSYFYSNVRKAIYGKQDYTEQYKKIDSSIKNTKYYAGKIFKKRITNRIVRCFEHKDINESSVYKINIVGRDKPYELKIKSIKLKVYDTGVATLSYFLENYEYRDKEDILKINDYGRRIYPQYIPLDNVKGNFLAKKLSITLKNRTIEEDFNYGVKNKPNKVSETIMKILGDRFISIEKELKEKCLEKEDAIFVRPIIDDRMFVICYYNSNFWSEILTKYNKGKYSNNDFWYQFVFVDNGGPTCQDEEMKKELLEKSTYTRWKDKETLFGISRYSFMLLCNESDFSKDVLYNHINTIYYEMILLALVQRASILRFSDETSRIATFESKDVYEQVKKLQEYYVKFVNTIYFREITAQEQGIELYDKITEFMRIEREVKRLDEEIDEIQRYITLQTNDKTNKLLNMLTFVGIGIAFLTLIATIVGQKNVDKKWIYVYQEVPLGIVICCILVFKKCIKNNKLMKILSVLIIGLITISAVYIFLKYKLFFKIIKFFG